MQAKTVLFSQAGEKWRLTNRERWLNMTRGCN
jgi:hypothetical protein